MARFELVTFDAYSGLADYMSTLVPVLERILGLSTDDAKALLKDWRNRQLAAAALSNSLGGERVPFRSCTAVALDHAARHYDVTVDDSQRMDLVNAWYPLDPWPEADRVLADLKARGYTLAILSNGDRDMLEALAGRLETQFDHILSTEQSGVYKPDPRVYALPQQELGIAHKDYLHVAGGAGDVVGAKSAGVACYWNNRGDDRVLFPEHGADFQGPDLTGLLEIL